MPTLLDHNLAAHPGGGLPPPPGGNDEGAGHGLRDYHAAKLALAAQLRLLREMLHKRGDERSQRQCEDLLRKLAEDRFTLAVLGQFKRGKSSLLNALVGRELLPVGVLPLTSANCRICEQSRAAEARRLDQLAALVLTTEGRTTYARSHGPCLRHLLRLVSLCADESVQAFLFAEGARHFAEIAEDMQSYGLKTEALRRELRNADEEDAWWRALTHLAGNRRVCSALSCDGEI